MGFDSVPDTMQSLEAKIINDFVDKLRILVYPHTFDLQMQVALAFQEHRQRMAYWREAHGLPNWPPTRENLAATPPMPLPFMDHNIPTLDNNLATSFGEGDTNFSGMPSWNSGSSSSSPFRQAINHSIMDTVSPRELLSQDSHLMTHPGPYHDDMGMFTFSDSDKSLPSLPQPPPMPSTHRRKTGQRSGTSSRSSQSHSHQQSRHPLPLGPGQSASKGQFVGFEAYGPPLGTGTSLHQQSYAAGSHEEQPHQEFILRSNAPASTTDGPKPSRPSRRQTTPHVQPHAFGGPLNMVSATAVTNPISNFPPGKNTPGFVPIGRVGVASAAQGNRWPIERKLMEQLVGAERGHGEHRPKTRLTYKEILAKYSRWDIKESTLRGIKRKITLPKEHRERKPRWDAEHVNALRLHVPLHTDKKGKVAWTKVVDAIKRDTGRPFGAGTTSKKWAGLNNKSRTKRGAAPDQRSQSGGEEGDVEENESSSSIFEIAEVSEEDLPSHKFSFQEGDDDDDCLGGVGRFAAINSAASGLQGSRMWH